MAKLKLKGNVVKNAMNNTVIVEVVRKKSHPRYKKVLSVKKKYYAHCDKELNVGQEVVMEESKPLSKTKRWRVVEIVEIDNKNQPEADQPVAKSKAKKK